MKLYRLLLVLGGLSFLLINSARAEDVHLAWTDIGAPSNTSGYNIYRGAKSDGSDLVYLAQVKVPALTYNDVGVTPGVHCYAVKRVTTVTDITFSNVRCKTTLAAPILTAP